MPQPTTEPTVVPEKGSEAPIEGTPEVKTPEVKTPEVKTPEAEPRDVSGLPKWAQDLVTNLRKENGDARVSAKKEAAEEARKEMAQEIGKALGLVKGEEKLDPQALAAQLRDSQVEMAVYKMAPKAGGDPDALLDSKSFMRSLAGLDPADEAKIADAIKAAVTSNTKLSAAPRAGSRSGTDSGGTGESAITKEAFDKMSGAERNKLFASDPDLYARLSGRSNH